MAVHSDVAETIDDMLRGRPIVREVRRIQEDGQLHKKIEKILPFSSDQTAGHVDQRKVTEAQEIQGVEKPRVYLFGVNRVKVEQAAREKGVDISVVPSLSQASVFVTSKGYYRKRPQKIRDAEVAGQPIYVLRSNSIGEIRQFLESLSGTKKRVNAVSVALKEAEEAIGQVMSGAESVELTPQTSYVRRLQHLLAERSQLASRSLGKEPNRRVEIFRSI